MKGDIRNKIYATINQLHDELDKSNELKKTLNFDKNFPELITIARRIKILKEFIELFKLVKNYKPTTSGIVLERNALLTKRVKLHFSQLKRLNDCVEDNMLFFTTLMKVLLGLVIYKKN